jgi:hypothetical protein
MTGDVGNCGQIVGILWAYPEVMSTDRCGPIGRI